MSKISNVRLVGHPFAPIGMGEHLRASFRSFRSAYLNPSITDIYKLSPPTFDDQKEFFPSCTDSASDINIYHINGNEVEQALAHLSYQEQWGGYNIIYPLWELSEYPVQWAEQLNKFDEIWSPSGFIDEALKKVCKKPVVKMPLACEVSLTAFHGRRFFNIPESDYIFLFFYDLKSYTTRKNPYAVIRAFKKLLSLRPYSNAHLVIKVNGIDANPKEYENIQDALKGLGSNVTLITKLMTGNEVKNLVRCVDCFISLHRSEGYGFGIAEAMVLGKPVIATSYSGNVEFMRADAAFGVDYKLIPLVDGDYPFYENQVWAEPDWEQAADYMVALLDDPQKGRDIGVKAQLHMQVNFSYRATGLRYLKQIEVINQCLVAV